MPRPQLQPRPAPQDPRQSRVAGALDRLRAAVEELVARDEVAAEYVAIVDRLARAADLAGPGQYATLAALAAHARTFALKVGPAASARDRELAGRTATVPESRSSAARHARYLQRKAAGRCTRCPRPAEMGRSRCPACLAAGRARAGGAEEVKEARPARKATVAATAPARA